MPRLIAFVLCIAFLVVGVSAPVAMGLGALTFLLLGGYLAWGIARIALA